MPEQTLIVNQYGLESVHGTAVAADTRLMCAVTMPESDRTVVVPKAGTGKRVPGNLDGATVQQIMLSGGRITTPEGLYYQFLPFLFSCLLKGNITPVEQTGGEGDYLWDFPDALTGPETLDTFTLETGDSSAANYGWEIPYGMFRDAELSGNADDGTVNLSATFDGTSRVATTLTSVATIPAYTGMVGGLARLYVDNTWAGLGSTEVAQSLSSWTLMINGGGHHKRLGSSSRLAGAHGQGEIVASLTVVVERNAATVAESLLYHADTTTKRFARLEMVSDVQIGTGDYHTFTADLAGVWRAWHPMGQALNGNSLDVATLEVGLDNTAVRSFNVSCITNVAAI